MLRSGSAATAELGAGGPRGSAGSGAEPGATWYYGREGQTVGPVKPAKIAELIRLEIITRDTLVWSENMADWQPAGQVGVFASQFE